MCGRINLRTSPRAWCQRFLPACDPETLPPEFSADFKPRYNIAPTQPVLVVMTDLETGERQLNRLRWGLIPPWADELSIGARMINARSETVHEKPSFRNAIAARRCLIVADGYYEWKKVADGKQPYVIERSGTPSPAERVLALAGLWETNTKASGDGSTLRTCTILTTDANQTTADIHHRMPVILSDDGADLWLDQTVTDPDRLKPLLVPALDNLLSVRAVNRHVNNARHDDERCLSPPDS
jgi:putative SOS response-associated peptidase YedK